MNEAGAMSALAGVLPRLLPGVRGVFSADDVRAALGVPSRFSVSTIATPVKLLCSRIHITVEAVRSGLSIRSKP